MMQKILPPVAFVFAVLSMLVLKACWPLAQVLPRPYHWLGIVLLAAGLAGAIWGSRKFARIGTNIKTFDAPNTLVTDGLFRWSRNPMYLGFVIALLGLGIVLNSASTLLVALAFLVLCDRWYVPFEEARMSATFGTKYAAYRQRTRRWL